MESAHCLLETALFQERDPSVIQADGGSESADDSIARLSGCSTHRCEQPFQYRVWYDYEVVVGRKIPKPFYAASTEN